MANQNDFTKVLTDAIGSAPFDASAIQEAFKNNAKFGEQFTKVALEAAEQSNEIASKWTKDTIARMGDVTSVKDEPAGYGKAMTDFASAQAESAAEHMAAFAEIAKKVQMETVELMMAAGKTASGDAATAAKKTAGSAKRPAGK